MLDKHVRVTLSIKERKIHADCKPTYRLSSTSVESVANHLQPNKSALLALSLHHHRRSSQIHHFLQTNHVHVGRWHARHGSSQPVVNILIDTLAVHVPSTHPQLQVTECVILGLTRNYRLHKVRTPSSFPHRCAVCKYSS